MRSITLPEMLILAGFATIVCIFPLWKIFSKAGYPGALALAMFVPFLNFVILFYLGFAKWPVLRELEALRRKD